MKTILLILLIQILADASGDAFRLKGKQLLHHLFEVVQIICWMALIYLFTTISSPAWIRLIAYYIALRFLIFDTIFNIIAGNPISYLGSPKNNLYAKFWHIFDKLKICTPESAANTFKYLIALPVVVSQIFMLN